MNKRFTRMISLNRDNIIQITQQADFFEKIPELLHVKEPLDQCRAAFNESAKQNGCRCRADTTLLFGCISLFLTTLEDFKQTNPAAIEKFLRYIAKDDNVESTGVTIYYAAPNTTTPVRYTFP